MKLERLIEIADEAYHGSGFIERQCHHSDSADATVVFIANLLLDTYNPDEGDRNLSLVASAMRTAVNELERVAQAFEEAEAELR